MSHQFEKKKKMYKCDNWDSSTLLVDCSVKTRSLTVIAENSKEADVVDFWKISWHEDYIFGGLSSHQWKQNNSPCVWLITIYSPWCMLIITGRTAEINANPASLAYIKLVLSWATLITQYPENALINQLPWIKRPPKSPFLTGQMFVRQTYFRHFDKLWFVS